jgi:hypothetical protein
VLVSAAAGAVAMILLFVGIDLVRGQHVQPPAVLSSAHVAMSAPSLSATQPSSAAPAPAPAPIENAKAIETSVHDAAAINASPPTRASSRPGGRPTTPAPRRAGPAATGPRSSDAPDLELLNQ